MKLYVIARRFLGKVQYLAVDEKRSKNKTFFYWSNDIEEGLAYDTYAELYDFAKSYFKNYNKWYITSYEALV